MRKLFFLVLGFISLQAVAQAPVVTKTEVNTLINSKLTNYVKPSDFKVVARKLSDFANQGDSIARSREPFIIPGSSGAYLNGLKQWIAFPDLSIYSQNGHTHAWSVITGRPTTVATSGITDAVSLAGSQTLTGKTIAGANNTITLTSAQITTPLGYTPVNGASAPSLVPTSNDVQNFGGALNYWSNGYIRQLNLNSTASMNGATSGKISFTGILKGNGAELTGIPYATGLTGQPTIPTNADYVDKTGDQSISGVKEFLSQSNFKNTWTGYQAVFGQIANNAGRIAFRNGIGAVDGVIGYGSATATDEFQFRGAGQTALVNAGNRTISMFSDGNVLVSTGGSAVNSGYKLDVQGTARFTGNVSIAAGSNISGGGSGLTGIPYTTGLTGQPTIPTNADYVDRSTPQTVPVVKSFIDTWVNYQAKFGSSSQAANIGFVNGSSAVNASIGYASSTANNDFRINSAGTLGLDILGVRKFQMFNSGNSLFQNGGTFADAGYLVDVQGTTRLNGGTDFGGILRPQSDNLYDIGASNRRVANTYSVNLLGNFIGNNTGSVVYGATNTANNVDFRIGSASQIVGGFFPSGNAFFQSRGVRADDSNAGLQASHDITATAGKAWGQTFTPILRAAANNDELIGTVIAPSLQAGAFTGVTQYALRVGSAMKMDGQIDLGGHVIPQADIVYNIGSSSRRFGAMYSTSFFGSNFLGTGATPAYGTSSTSFNIDIRSGSATQLVAGWHPSGHMFVQPRGVRPADSGEDLQVNGTSSFSGEFRNVIGNGGFKTSSTLVSDGITFYHINSATNSNNYFLMHSLSHPNGEITGLNSSKVVNLSTNGIWRVNVTDATTRITNELSLSSVGDYPDNAAAVAAGKGPGTIYRTGDLLKIVH